MEKARMKKDLMQRAVNAHLNTDGFPLLLLLYIICFFLGLFLSLSPSLSLSLT